MAILDTGTIIDISRASKGVATALKEAEKQGEPFRISTISIFELSNGLPAGLDDKRRELIEPMEIVPLGAEHAERGGIIHRELRAKGQDIGPFDCLIAATALCENEPVITPNAKHFTRVSGLKVITY